MDQLSYPDATLMMKKYRRGSGGKGQRRGGDGIRKTLRAQADASATFLGERHLSGPPGAKGGQSGKPGALYVERGGKRKRLASKSTVQLQVGDAIEVHTPGGGGLGRA